jgi:group II intron reverse transcriptase/maturase
VLAKDGRLDEIPNTMEECEMQKAEIVLSITEQKAKSNVNYKFDRLYRNFFNPDFFLKAYAKIYAKEGNMTSGSDGSTIDGFGLERISKAIEALKSEKYYFKPARRVYIPKKNGSKRPLGIPSFMDKIVQDISRSLLESIFEPQFSPNSHGFRPNRSCHTALKQIKREWTGIKWVIEGDIKGFFDNIDHNILLEILKEKILDGRFIELVRRMLIAGYIDDWKFNATFSGTPQGSAVSPILANIYLDKLDKFIEQVIIPKYQTNTIRRKANPQYTKITHQLDMLSKKIDAMDKNNVGRRDLIQKYKSLQISRREFKAVDSMDNDFVRIKYVRYADDFVIGVIGSKDLTEKIKTDIATFLTEQLKLTLSLEKTLITHFNGRKNPVKFLGYELFSGTENSKIKKRKDGSIARSINEIPRLSIPFQAITKKLEGIYVRGKTVHRSGWLSLDLAEIIIKYSAEVRGLYNYYRMADNVSRMMSKFRYYHRLSLAKTIAAKMKISVKQTRKKYSVDGTIGIVIKRDPPKKNIIYKYYNDGFQKDDFITKANHSVDNLPSVLNIRNSRNGIIKRLHANKCEYCDCEATDRPLEVHHIRKLKDLKKKYQGAKQIPKWVWLMSTRNRVLCVECHYKLHSDKL